MTPAEASPTPPPAAGSGSRRRTTWIFALAAALHGLLFLLALQPWMGEDEPWQLEYARHVAAGYRPWGGTPLMGARPGEPDERTVLPSSQLQARRRFHAIPAERLEETQREITRSMAEQGFYQRVDWAGVEADRSNFDQLTPDFTATIQPPLYYLLAGGWIRLCGARSVEQQLWAARGLSWLMYVATALVALAFARTVFDDERAALCAAALVAFLPMSARQAAVVNNDVLAKLLATLVLWISARWLRGRGRAWELGLATALCVLGLLTKNTAAGAVGALALALLLRSERIGARLSARTAVLLVLSAAGATALLWVFQHSPAVPRSLAGFITRVERSLDPATWSKFARTLAGSFGWESRFLPGPVNLALAGVVVAGLAACARRGARGTSRRVLGWCAAVVLVQIALIALRGVAVGRYLIPVLPTLAALLVGGLVASAHERNRARAALCFVLALIAYDALFLWGGLVANEVLRLGA